MRLPLFLFYKWGLMIITGKVLQPRRKHDFYPTEPRLCAAALNYVPFAPKSILDPGCGTGNWGSAAKELWKTSLIYGVDIEQQGNDCYEKVVISDFRAPYSGLPDKYDLVMGNPPYKYAEEFVRKGHAMLSENGCLIFLLRLSFLESRRRAVGLWADLKLSSVYVLANRPSFTDNGKTDDLAYALFVWDKSRDKEKQTDIRWMLWR